MAWNSELYAHLKIIAIVLTVIQDSPYIAVLSSYKLLVAYTPSCLT